MARVEDYRTEEQIAAHVRKQKAFLYRRRAYVAPAKLVECVNGPWAGEHIALRTDGRTLTFRVGNWLGRYVNCYGKADREAIVDE